MQYTMYVKWSRDIQNCDLGDDINFRTGRMTRTLIAFSQGIFITLDYTCSTTQCIYRNVFCFVIFQIKRDVSLALCAQGGGLINNIQKESFLQQRVTGRPAGRGSREVAKSSHRLKEREIDMLVYEICKKIYYTTRIAHLSTCRQIKTQEARRCSVLN